MQGTVAITDHLKKYIITMKHPIDYSSDSNKFNVNPCFIHNLIEGVK
jgi:hypothetical protein